MEFCCEQMYVHIHERERIIYYDCSTRKFAIRVSTRIIQRIQFCPWCGKELPKDLTDELSKIIFDQLDLEDYDDPRMPEEFKSDEWWKKRGL